LPLNIIGIAGRAGVGKSTVAEMLVRKFDFAAVSLADPLKRVAKELWGFTEEQLWGPSEKRNEPDPRWPKSHAVSYGVCPRCGVEIDVLGRPVGAQACVALSPREALQLLGTEVGRRIHEQTWTAYLMRVAERLVTEGGWYAPAKGWAGWRVNESGFNEPGPLKYVGVAVPDVRFPNEADAIKKVGGRMWLVDRPGIGLTGAASKHASETSMEGYAYDAVVPNGTLETLEERVRSVL
jgi:hypothetical protein